MFKLLVVDDEPIIVEGLCDVFQEHRAEGELDVHKAYNSQEALVILEEIRFDVVVTDIKMPGMDGLQLMAHIKRRWPDCRIVILTGYDEFEYIYKANSHPGVRYLLKNESFEKIRETVDSCLNEVANSYHDDKLLSEAEEKKKMALPLLRRELLAGLLDPATEAVLTQAALDEFEIPLKVDQPIYMVMGCVVGNDGADLGFNRTAQQVISFAVERQLSPYARLAGFTCWRDYYLCLIQSHGEHDGADLVKYFKRLLEEAQSICKEAGLGISFTVSAGALPWDQIGGRATAMRRILNHLVWQGMEIIVTDTEYGEPQTNDLFAEISLIYKTLGSLSTLIEQGKEAEFFQMFTKLEKLSDSHAEMDSAIFYSLTVMLAAYRASLSEQPHPIKIQPEEQDAKQSMDGCRRLALSIFQAQAAISKRRSDTAIQKVQEYIHGNLAGDLSLSNLAGLVFFNPKYLSRLYKLETGTNLSEYINDAKMARAIELLADKTLKIHEVGNEIGYFSSAYFTKFFRKNMHISPKEYRDSIGINIDVG